MASYSLDWLADALRLANLRVVEVTGWRGRGHGDVKKTLGVLCHHTAGARTGNMGSLNVVTHGRPGLSGPLCNLALGRDGTWYAVAAGRAYHAGDGRWQGVINGNSQLVGIEAENAGYIHGPKADFPWPAVQMEAYARGVAAILDHIGQPVIMCAGHKEYALPRGRKTDPTFDMDAFRKVVAAYMKAPTGAKGHRRARFFARFSRLDMHDLVDGCCDDCDA
jgi:hypothetical protein